MRLPKRAQKHEHMFEVKKTPIGRFDAFQLINKSTGEFIEILSGLGAGINDLQVRNSRGQLVSMIGGYKSDEEIRKIHHTIYRGSKLSPFPNRIPAGKYTFKGTSYQLPVNEISLNNHLHALLHYRWFDVVAQEANEEYAKLVLNHDYHGTYQGFPFPYSAQIEFRLNNEEVTIATSITNTSDEEMPLGDGWHPYFKFQSLDDVKFSMSPARRIFSLAGNENGDVHGFESSTRLGDSKLDDCFESMSPNGKFRVYLEDEHSGTKLQVWQESEKGKYRYIQVYTPDSRQEIAIEPVSCPPNAFNTGEGLIVLGGGETTEMKIGVQFSAIQN